MKEPSGLTGSILAELSTADLCEFYDSAEGIESRFDSARKQLNAVDGATAALGLSDVKEALEAALVSVTRGLAVCRTVLRAAEVELTKRDVEPGT